MDKHSFVRRVRWRMAVLLAVAVLGLADALPAYSQANNEVRSGRIGVEFGKTRYGRKGSQYKSRRNNIMENNSKMGFWSVGLIGGGSFNWQTRDAGYAYDMTFDGAWGAHAGVTGTYMFYDWLTLRADILYTQKNYKMRRMHPALQDLNIHSNYTNHYLQVPVMVDWTFGSLVKGHIFTGAYGAAWLGGKVARVTPLNKDEQVSTYQFTPEDNHFDGGVVGGVGVSWDPIQYIRISAEAMLYYSLVNTVKRQPVMNDSRYNNTVVIGLSARYVF